METDGAGLEFQGHNSIDWYGLNGLAGKCLGNHDKLRWLQLLRALNRVVTRSWVSCDTQRPRDMCSTWYLNKERLRGWDHHAVVVRDDARELKQVKGPTGRKFKSRVLGTCFGGKESWSRCRKDWRSLTSVKATSTARRNRGTFTVPEVGSLEEGEARTKGF